MFKKNLLILLLILIINIKNSYALGPGILIFLGGGLLSIITHICIWTLGNFLFNAMLAAIGGAILGPWAIPLIFITAVLFPFITVFLIVYGFLSELRIFRYKNWINAILAFTITTSTFYVPLPFLGGPIFRMFVYFLFSALTYWSVFLFGVMFFVGTIYLFNVRRLKWQTSAGVYAAYKDEVNSLRFELKSVNESLALAMQNLAKESDPNKRAEIEKTIEKLTEQRDDISDRIRGLEEVKRRL